MCDPWPEPPHTLSPSTGQAHPCATRDPNLRTSSRKQVFSAYEKISRAPAPLSQSGSLRPYRPGSGPAPCLTPSFACNLMVEEKDWPFSAYKCFASREDCETENPVHATWKEVNLIKENRKQKGEPEANHFNVNKHETLKGSVVLD